MRLGQPPPTKRSFFQRYGSLGAFLLAMSLLGFLAQFQWIGYVVIFVYIVIALIKRMPASVTFIAALLTLGMVPVAIVFANWNVAQNFAAYSFVLLIFGVIATTIELQRSPRTTK